MDSIGEKIIQILQKDGRISMQKLAKELPMSVPATCDRVRKLEDYVHGGNHPGRGTAAHPEGGGVRPSHLYPGG